MSTIKIRKDDIEGAVEVAVTVLKNGGVIVYPTDTVYGIGGDATNRDVVERIHKIKRIEGKRPMSVMVPDFGMIDYYCESGLWEDIILRKYLPGPYTFILRKHRYLAASESDNLGVRIPDSEFCQLMCESFGKPIITTSANLTKQSPPTKFEDVDPSIIEKADLAIDGGQTKYGRASVVIDLVGHKLLREGGKGEINLIDLPEP
ncbi:MAG: L-threonylcarbamoyladenylate synthase [Candidatus Micrarchaeia archaeon]